MRNSSWAGAALLGGVALLAACSSDDGDPDEGVGGSAMATAGSGGSTAGAGGAGHMAGVSFTEVHPIFVAKCSGVGCHDTVDGFLPEHAVADIDVAYAAATGMFNGAPVYESILDRAGPDSASLMPPSYAAEPCFFFGEGGCLTEGEYELIEQWVEGGLNP